MEQWGVSSASENVTRNIPEHRHTPWLSNVAPKYIPSNSTHSLVHIYENVHDDFFL